MAELVTSVAEIIANINTLHRYSSGDERQRRFHATRIKNGKLFVALSQGAGYLFAPSKFAGYRENDLSHEADLDSRDGGITNQRITKLLGNAADMDSIVYQTIDRAFTDYCSQMRITPSRHHMARRYWLVASFALPDEIAATDDIFEGALERVTVNRYERSPEARRACVDHHGYDCAVCGFNFESIYGSIGQAYIHVHHIVPIASVGDRYQVDPVNDLRPVCPNCHAMLHRGNPVLSIDGLKALLNKKQ